MVAGAGMKCIKYLLFIFNFLFLLAGLALVIVGAIAQAEQSKIHHVSSPAILVIVIGSVIFGLSFFGCCGAIKENQCMLVTFGILMTIVLVLCIAAVICAFVFKNQVKKIWREPLKESLEEYTPDVKGGLWLWSELQLKEECCGVDNYTDWFSNAYYNNKSGSEILPGSCCGDKNKTSTCLATDKRRYQVGCIDAVTHAIEDDVVIVGAVVGGVAILELLGIIFAFALANAIHKGYNVV